MSRNLRLLLAIVVIAGLFAYRFVRDHHAPPAHAAAAARPAGAPVPKRMLGRIAFTPCTLAPQFGAGSVEAQCGTLAVAENPAKTPNTQKYYSGDRRWVLTSIVKRETTLIYS